MMKVPRWLRELASARINALMADGKQYGNCDAIMPDVERIEQAVSMVEIGFYTPFEAARMILREQ